MQILAKTESDNHATLLRRFVFGLLRVCGAGKRSPQAGSCCLCLTNSNLNVDLTLKHAVPLSIYWLKLTCSRI